MARALAESASAKQLREMGERLRQAAMFVQMPSLLQRFNDLDVSRSLREIARGVQIPPLPSLAECVLQHGASHELRLALSSVVNARPAAWAAVLAASPNLGLAAPRRSPLRTEIDQVQRMAKELASVFGPQHAALRSLDNIGLGLEQTRLKLAALAGAGDVLGFGLITSS